MILRAGVVEGRLVADPAAEVAEHPAAEVAEHPAAEVAELPAAEVEAHPVAEVGLLADEDHPRTTRVLEAQVRLEAGETSRPEGWPADAPTRKRLRKRLRKKMKNGSGSIASPPTAKLCAQLNWMVSAPAFAAR
jgi:hypothetical protein